MAESTIPSVMELSGCDAVFVLEDADLNLVSDSLLFGLTLNNSQTCMAPRRVFATNQQTDKLLELIQLKIAAWTNNSTTELIAPSSRQAASAAQKIRDAMAAGAKLVHGAQTVDNNSGYTGITILDHVTAEMSVAQSDIFMPVLSFLRVESENHALLENAKCPFALCATVFGSTALCQQLARKVNAGCVVINDIIVPTADPRVPFGGRGISGHGMTRGAAGLLEMTQLKAIVTARLWFKPHLAQPTTADADVLEQLIRLEHAASPLQKLFAVPKMIQATMQQMKLRRGH
jgi:aldehyde dehydrogenase (NAD+)